MRKHCTRRVRELKSPLFFIEGVKPLAASKADTLALKELTALDALAHGQGTLQCWHDLSAMLNICETLARAGVGGAEALPDCAAAQAGLVDAARRFEATGRMELSGEALAALRAVCEWQEAQREAIPLAQYERAINVAYDRVRSGAAGVVEVV
jgi:hypothetical protein